MDKATIESCRKAISNQIVYGNLPGNGTDKTAERNGLILAVNILANLMHEAPGKTCSCGDPLCPKPEQDSDLSEAVLCKHPTATWRHDGHTTCDVCGHEVRVLFVDKKC